LRLNTLSKHHRLLSIFVLLGTTISSGIEAFASNAEWKQIDHKGDVSKPQTEESRIPLWAGWKEKAEPSRGGFELKYRTKTLSDGTELRFYYQDVWGPTCDDRFTVRLQSPDGRNKHGFVDRSGALVVPPKYIWVEHYYNGLVAVREEKGSPWLLLDKSGKVKYTLPKDIKPETSARFWGVSANGILPAKKGDPDDLYSFKNFDGLYDVKSQQFYPLGHFVVINEFSEGLTCFNTARPRKHGYADAKGKIVIPAQFDEAGNFKDGVAMVRLGEQRGLIDHTGKFVMKLPSECLTAEPLCEGLAAVVIKNSKGEPKWGFVDKNGKVVIPAIYYADEQQQFFWNIPRFSEGLAHVAIGDEVNHKYGFIDKTGNWKITPQFKDANDFINGFARVQTGESGFSKSDWNEKQGFYVHRSGDFDLFVKQYGLLGKSKSEVVEAFGKPDKRFIDGAVYDLNTSSCGNAYKGVEIHYDGDKVTKYRSVSFDGHGDWIDKSEKASPH
jgi:hypothetical protein